MASTGEVRPAPEQPSVLDMLRQPRVMLVLLAIWDIVGVLAQLLSDSFLFDMKTEASGILGDVHTAKLGENSLLNLVRNCKAYAFLRKVQVLLDVSEDCVACAVPKWSTDPRESIV